MAKGQVTTSFKSEVIFFFTPGFCDTIAAGLEGSKTMWRPGSKVRIIRILLALGLLLAFIYLVSFVLNVSFSIVLEGCDERP